MLKKALKWFALSVGVAFALFVLVGVIAVVTQGDSRPSSDVVAAALEPAAEPTPEPHAWIEVDGLYVTFGLDYLAAPTEEQLRRGLHLAGAEGRLGAADTSALERIGVRRVNGRLKVRVLALSADGQLVNVEGVESGERLWTVAEGIAMPIVDRDRERIRVGGSYVVTLPTVGAATQAELRRADQLVSAALPERELFEDRPDDDYAQAVARVAKKNPGIVPLQAGHRLSVVDFDPDSSSVVKVRRPGSDGALWVYAIWLSRERLPAAAR